MPCPRVEPKDIFKESNVLLLTKSRFFQNTTKIVGSYCADSIQRVEPRFFGYVYRCVADDQLPIMFANGIFPVQRNIETGEDAHLQDSDKTYGCLLMDISTPVDLTVPSVASLDTYVCYHQACCIHPFFNLTCLLDIRELGGIVRSQSQRQKRKLKYKAFAGFSITQKIFDVTHYVPSF